MKRAILVLAASCSVFVIGCGSSGKPGGQSANSQADQAAVSKEKKDIWAPNPLAAKMTGMAPQERAEYLRGLAKDPSFDPKQQVDLLKLWADDKDPEIAAAAKVLLDKAQ